MRIAISFAGIAVIAATLTACSSVEPLETAATSTGNAPRLTQTDQTIIVQKVGEAGLGTAPVAWANPATGSAGVIERIAASNSGSNCRQFVSTEQTLDGVSHLSGLACRASNTHWTLHTIE